MNKFYMNGKLIHKASDRNTKRCEVEKWVFLPHSGFKRLKANPYQEHKSITAFVQNAALIYDHYKTSEAEQKLHNMIKETVEKIAELAHTDKTDLISADMIGMDRL